MQGRLKRILVSGQIEQEQTGALLLSVKKQAPVPFQDGQERLFQTRTRVRDEKPGPPVAAEGMNVTEMDEGIFPAGASLQITF